MPGGHGCPVSGDAVMPHAWAVMRVLEGDLIGIFAGCLSPAAGRGNTGLSALPLAGGPRWHGRAGGTLEDAGMWASSPHTTQSGSARSRMGPHLPLPVQLDPAARLPPRHPRVMPSRVPQPVCSGGADGGRSAASGTTIDLDWCWVVIWWVCPWVTVKDGSGSLFPARPPGGTGPEPVGRCGEWAAGGGR